MSFPSFLDVQRKTTHAAEEMGEVQISAEVKSLADRAMDDIKADLLKKIDSFGTEYALRTWTNAGPNEVFSFRTILMKVDAQEVNELSDDQQAQLASQVDQNLRSHGYSPDVTIDFTTGLSHSAFLEIKFEVPLS